MLVFFSNGLNPREKGNILVNRPQKWMGESLKVLVHPNIFCSQLIDSRLNLLVEEEESFIRITEYYTNNGDKNNSCSPVWYLGNSLKPL